MKYHRKKIAKKNGKNNSKDTQQIDLKKLYTSIYEIVRNIHFSRIVQVVESCKSLILLADKIIENPKTDNIFISLFKFIKIKKIEESIINLDRKIEISKSFEFKKIALSEFYKLNEDELECFRQMDEIDFQRTIHRLVGCLTSIEIKKEFNQLKEPNNVNKRITTDNAYEKSLHRLSRHLNQQESGLYFNLRRNLIPDNFLSPKDTDKDISLEEIKEILISLNNEVWQSGCFNEKNLSQLCKFLSASQKILCAVQSKDLAVDYAIGLINSAALFSLYLGDCEALEFIVDYYSNSVKSQKENPSQKQAISLFCAIIKTKSLFKMMDSQKYKIQDFITPAKQLSQEFAKLNIIFAQYMMQEIYFDYKIKYIICMEDHEGRYANLNQLYLEVIDYCKLEPKDVKEKTLKAGHVFNIFFYFILDVATLLSQEEFINKSDRNTINEIFEGIGQFIKKNPSNDKELMNQMNIINDTMETAFPLIASSFKVNDYLKRQEELIKEEEMELANREKQILKRHEINKKRALKKAENKTLEMIEKPIENIEKYEHVVEIEKESKEFKKLYKNSEKLNQEVSEEIRRYIRFSKEDKFHPQCLKHLKKITEGLLKCFKSIEVLSLIHGQMSEHENEKIKEAFYACYIEYKCYKKLGSLWIPGSCNLN